jgi:protein-S-isoprenylcysteine O-methyltransferase Ste14
MNAYYQTHSAALMLYLLVVLGWYTVEVIEFFRQRHWRSGVTRVGPHGFLAAWAAYAIVAITVLFLAPHIVPAAAFGHDVAGFAAGMVMLAAGVALRLWSFQALGRYFTFTVKVSPDQPVVTAGPYRLLRHPGYAGGLLATTGIGVLWGNWVSVAAIALPLLAIIIWRIRFEENALLTGLDDRYRSYASQHKRLVPLIW